MTREEALTVLGLSDSAGRDDIVAAHRELAQMLHPDKFGDNKRLRSRAEQQMKRINAARDALLRGSQAPRGASARRSSHRTHTTASPASADGIRFEAEARARAAETARLAVVAQLRTMRERRRGMAGMVAVAAVVMYVCSRMRGTVGMLAFSVASMLVVWGLVDVVSLSGQVGVLQKRAAELLHQRDAALHIAEEAARL